MLVSEGRLGWGVYRKVRCEVKYFFPRHHKKGEKIRKVYTWKCEHKYKNNFVPNKLNQFFYIITHVAWELR